MAASSGVSPLLDQVMLKKIGIALVALLVLLVAFIASRRDTYHVERAVFVVAPVDLAYSFVSDLRAFNRFSPWSELDPNMQTTYSGSETGVGSVYEWKGNDAVGSGRMTVTDATPNERVEIRLEFIEPFASTAVTTFTVTPEGGGARVSWSMKGNNNFLSKAFSLVFNMEKTIGADFEKGLDRLSRLIQAEVLVQEELARQAAGAELGDVESLPDVVRATP